MTEYDEIIALKEDGKRFGLNYSQYMSIGSARTVGQAKKMLRNMKRLALNELAIAAAGLCYPAQAIDDIHNAISLYEADRIMVSCRKGEYKPFHKIR